MARIVGGPMDGQGIVTDDENPYLPASFVVDSSEGRVGYRLERGAPGTEWRYVVDCNVAATFIEELWGEDPPVAREGDRWVERKRTGDIPAGESH